MALEKILFNVIVTISPAEAASAARFRNRFGVTSTGPAYDLIQN